MKTLVEIVKINFFGALEINQRVSTIWASSFIQENVWIMVKIAGFIVFYFALFPSSSQDPW